MRALLARFPRLADTLARAELHLRETTVETWHVGDTMLLAKRDDLNAPVLGGNKARALELLLAGADPSRLLLTVGATGSTHALAVARHGALLGFGTEVITWPQETHAVADATAANMRAIARVTPARSVADAYARATWRRLTRRVHWVPAGGSSPLGALGHVDAALELVEQLARDNIAAPDVLVVPLGSGGTAAGLIVGLALARVETRVIAVQVVPRLLANSGHVMRLAHRTRSLLAFLTGETLPSLRRDRLHIECSGYGGAYGRETPEARRAAAELRASGGPPLDGTYSAKAFGVALARARRMPDERVLFWLTFDGRWLAERVTVAPSPSFTSSPPSR